MIHADEMTELDAITLIDSVKPHQLTLGKLEELAYVCDSHWTALVFLGDLVKKAACGVDPSDVLDIAVDALEAIRVHDKVPNIKKMKVQDILMTQLWSHLSDHNLGELEPYLKRLITSLDRVAVAYDKPCYMKHQPHYTELKWAELQPFAKLFVTQKLQVSIIDVFHWVKLIRFKNGINMQTVQGEDRKLYVEYDAFLDRLVGKFPILDKLLDPPYVLVQALAGGNVPADVAVVIGQLPALPSGIIPQLVADDIDPHGGNFSAWYRCGTQEDSRCVAAALRSHFQDAAGGGGPGPAVRISVFMTGNRRTEFY